MCDQVLSEPPGTALVLLARGSPADFPRCHVVSMVLPPSRPPAAGRCPAPPSSPGLAVSHVLDGGWPSGRDVLWVASVCALLAGCTSFVQKCHQSPGKSVTWCLVFVLWTRSSRKALPCGQQQPRAAKASGWPLSPLTRAVGRVWLGSHVCSGSHSPGSLPLPGRSSPGRSPLLAPSSLPSPGAAGDPQASPSVATPVPRAFDVL